MVQVQHPRMDPRRFDLVVVNRHDELTGPNVVVTRTALHRVTPARLAEAAQQWRPRFAHLQRPLVAVLVGGSNGRFRLDGAVGGELAGQLAAMMRRDEVGVAVTPSRRTDPAATQRLREALEPLGGYVWDGSGDNPYFGMLALADAIVVTMDSVSMISEAVATAAPVMLAVLPGRSRRNGLFTDALLAEGRVREFAGRFELWPVTPLERHGGGGGGDVPPARPPYAEPMLNIQTFDNRAGGNVLYKALAHPLAAEAIDRAVCAPGAAGRAVRSGGHRRGAVGAVSGCAAVAGAVRARRDPVGTERAGHGRARADRYCRRAARGPC